MAALKRMFKLGVRDGVVPQAPHISMLQENNARQGFSTGEQFDTFLPHLHESLQPLFQVAYITGWRVESPNS